MSLINAEALSRCPTILVNQAFTMIAAEGLEPSDSLCHWRRMATRKPMAGGFFWMAAILTGAVWGIAAGNPMKGILIGTAAGAGIAILIWLLDRPRRGA